MPKVLYEKRERIAYVTLNRPEAKNAIDPETHRQLWQIWEDFRDDDGLDIAILTGAGDAFCAGADLKTYIPSWIGADARRVRENVGTGIGGIHARSAPYLQAGGCRRQRVGARRRARARPRVRHPDRFRTGAVRLVRGAPRLSPWRWRDRAPSQHLWGGHRARDAPDRRADLCAARAPVQSRLAGGLARPAHGHCRARRAPCSAQRSGSPSARPKRPSST